MSVEDAAQAFRRQAWSEAYSAFRSSDEDSELSGTDLDRFGLVAYLIGRDEEGARIWERAHTMFLEAGERPSAARCAFWLGMAFMDRGEMAHAGGWLSRSRRILDDVSTECAEHGYLLVPQGLQLLEEGDATKAKELLEAARAIGQRFNEEDLIALGCLGSGQSSIRQGDVLEGTTLLDEAMVTALSGAASPLVTGIIYCAVVEACIEMFDLRRAQEWTEALARWCAAQPDLVPFKGRCQVYRSEVLQIQGNWQGAFEAACDAERDLSGPPQHPAVGAAYYQQGELLRLRGALSDADEAFRRAEQWGRSPEPGRALLRLAQRRNDAARSAIQHALHESRNRYSRAHLLAAAAEIFLAVGDISAAREAKNELCALATALEVPWVTAEANRAAGAVWLGEGHPRAAADSLRVALGVWQTFAAPFEVARTHALLAQAAREQGDLEAADAHLAAATLTFRQLGADYELRMLAGASGGPGAAPGGLTSREVEILKLIATGMTNRAIAANLTISEKTVANHVANVLGKLGLSSRAAATAYAYEHNVV